MTKSRRNNKTLIIRIIVLLLTVVSACAMTGCAGGKNESGGGEETKGFYVDVVMPRVGNITVTGEYLGVTAPDQQVTVFPKLPGEVLSVYFGVGDVVEAGDVLFTVNATDIVNNIRTLEAQIASNVEQAMYAVQQREMALNQAIVAYDVIAKSYDDTAALFAAEIVSGSALEQAETALLNAEIAVGQARSALEQANSSYAQALESQRAAAGPASGGNASGGGQGQAAPSAVSGSDNVMVVNLRIAQAKLSDATIRAPISGVIESCNIEPFDMASPAVPAFVISNKDSMAVSFKIPRSTHEHINPGDRITLIDGGAEYGGVITEISTMVDASGLFTVKANISGSASTLISGAHVKVLAVAQKAENIMIVPLRVIYYENGLPYIYALRDGVARKFRVETGIFDTENIQIISGLRTDEQIISTWSSRLTDGAEVIPVSETDGQSGDGEAK